MTTDDTEVESNVESQPYGSQASVSSSYMQHASVNDIVIMVAKPVFLQNRFSVFKNRFEIGFRFSKPV